MTGNFHVRFLGGRRRVTNDAYRSRDVAGESNTHSKSERIK